MAAIISGSTLSMLFYDHSSTLGNQEGLLTGKVVDHVQDTISDSQINNVKVETKIYIYGCTCQSRFESFHDNKGNICHIDKSAVGWYRYRHNTSHRMSMKEKSIHQTLLKNLQPDKYDNFIFVLCTSKKSENLSTCNFDYTIFKYDLRDKIYVTVPVTVINLGDTTHTEYRSNKSCTVDYDSGTLASLLSTFEHELLGKDRKTSEAAGVQKMAESLQTQLQCLTHGVMETDHELHELHSEVEQMELDLQKKIEKKRAMKPLPPSPTSPDGVPMEGTHAKEKMSKEETTARLRREQRRKEQQKSFYPNLSGLKVSSGGSRTRRLSDDNYLIDLNGGNISSLHTQMDNKCHLLDSPVETAEETLSPESNLSVGNSAGARNHRIDDRHIDIPFADSEGFIHEQQSTQEETKSAKIRTDAISDKSKSSDPFAFVEGMIATSKNESDMPKKKVNNTSSKETTNSQLNESTNSLIKQNSTSMSNKHLNIKTVQNKAINQRLRSRSREKQTTNRTDKLQNSRRKSPDIDLSHTGSDEDIFDTKEENEDNLNLISISASPVF